MPRLYGLTEQEQRSPGEFRGNLSAVCLSATNRTVIAHSFSHTMSMFIKARQFWRHGSHRLRSKNMERYKH